MQSKKIMRETNLVAGILGFLGIVLVLTLSGCVEQKKDVTLSMADEMISPVNSSPIILYAKFNESVNGSVNFYINDEFIGKADSNGSEVFMEYNKSLSPGEYKVKAIFPGNEQFNNASVFSTLKIYKLNTGLDIDFEPNKRRIYFKDPLKVKARLYAEGKRKCANKEILFYVDDKFFGKDLTNNKCIAEWTFNNLSAGRLNIKAEYKGNEIYKGAKASKEIIITSKIPVKIFANDTEVELTKNATISADVKDYLGRNVSNPTLKVIYKGISIANLTAEHNTFVLNTSKFGLGSHRLQIVFNGSKIYENASKDIFVEIINKYDISGVEVKAEIPLEQMFNKKISVYTDDSNISKYCAYELEPISDQKGGYKIQIRKGKKDSIFLGKFFGIITVKDDMLSCHVFLCMDKNISCSIPDVVEALGNLKNLSIAIDKDVSGKSLIVYDDIIGALGYIQAYFFQHKRKIYIKQYLINSSKCELSPTKTFYQNLTAKEVNDCNFSGIFIRNADKRFMGVKDGRILLEGDEDGLFVEETILKWLIAPEYAYYLRTKNIKKK